MDSDESLEKLGSSKKPQAASSVTLQKAVEMGEYDPKFLSGFPEWHGLSRHVQFQYIQQALNNRRGHLLQQYAAINNVMDFSKKPHLLEALKNIEDQLEELNSDREKLLMEYSK